MVWSFTFNFRVSGDHGAYRPVIAQHSPRPRPLHEKLYHRHLSCRTRLCICTLSTRPICRLRGRGLATETAMAGIRWLCPNPPCNGACRAVNLRSRTQCACAMLQAERAMTSNCFALFQIVQRIAAARALPVPSVSAAGSAVLPQGRAHAQDRSNHRQFVTVGHDAVETNAHESRLSM